MGMFRIIDDKWVDLRWYRLPWLSATAMAQGTNSLVGFGVLTKRTNCLWSTDDHFEFHEEEYTKWRNKIWEIYRQSPPDGS
jgi:hypothetical protein